MNLATHHRPAPTRAALFAFIPAAPHVSNFPLRESRSSSLSYPRPISTRAPHLRGSSSVLFFSLHAKISQFFPTQLFPAQQLTNSCALAQNWPSFFSTTSKLFFTSKILLPKPFQQITNSCAKSVGSHRSHPRQPLSTLVPKNFRKRKLRTKHETRIEISRTAPR